MVYQYFGICGTIEQIVFGRNSRDQQKIGFAFIEFSTHNEACDAVDYLNGTELIESRITVQLDPGFEEGRQYGRGETGHQRYREKDRKLKKYERKLTAKKFKDIKFKQNLDEVTDLFQATSVFDNDNDKPEVKNADDDKEEDKDKDEDVDLKQINNDKQKEKEKEKEKQEEEEAEKEELSQWDVLLPQKKKRKIDPNIERKLWIAAQRIDEEDRRKRRKKLQERKQNEEHQFSNIIDMMSSNMKLKPEPVKNENNNKNQVNNSNDNLNKVDSNMVDAMDSIMEKDDDDDDDDDINDNNNNNNHKIDGDKSNNNGYKNGYRNHFGKGKRGNFKRKKVVAKRRNDSNKYSFDRILNQYKFKFIDINKNKNNDKNNENNKNRNDDDKINNKTSQDTKKTDVADTDIDIENSNNDVMMKTDNV